MADSKISALTTATTPLAGTEVLPIVQSGATKKTTVSDLLLDGSVTPTKLSTGHPSWTTTGHQSATSTTDANTAANVQTYSKNITNSKAAIRIQDTASSATTAFKADRNGYDSRAYISVTNTSQTEFDAVAVYGDTGNVNINTGNLVIGTSGKGIDFSATPQPAGMTSELLADYEEGTWTPTATNFTVLSGSATWSGSYTKVGRIVTAYFRVSGGSFTMTAGSTTISLPFTASTYDVGGYTNPATGVGFGGLSAAASSATMYVTTTTAAQSQFSGTITYSV